MATLVTGPSSAGKSTFIDQRSRFGLAGGRVKYGFQLTTEDVEADDIIHYNLLHPVTCSGAENLNGSEPDFFVEPVFSKIIESGKIDKCYVIVASEADLLRRAGARSIWEHTHPRPYDNDFWTRKIKELNLFAVYEGLFDSLVKHSIPFEVFFSVGDDAVTFLLSDRVHIHANLRGIYIQPWPAEAIRRIQDDPKFHYQIADLPGGGQTRTRGYDHLQGRADLRSMLPDDCRQGSFLDIGCALGQLLFSAERRGADRLLGVDVSDTRIAAARELAAVLGSRATFVRANFNDLTLSERFDHVFALNVIHHVADFRGLLQQACVLAKQSLTVEFPTLDDPLFNRTVTIDDGIKRQLAALPLIGISTKAVDQSYVFSPAAIERLVIDDIAIFSGAERIPSTIRDRVALRFFHQTVP